MAGRGLRIDPSKKVCNIVQSKKTKYPFTRNASPASSFIHKADQWLSLSGNSESIEKSVLNALQALSETDVQLPNFLLKAKKLRRSASQAEFFDNNMG